MRTLKHIVIIFTIYIASFLATDYIYSFYRNYSRGNLDEGPGSQGAQHLIYHHDLKKNTDFIMFWDEISYRDCTDSNGFRFHCDDPNNHEKNFDIAFIGDSFTQGALVPYDEAFVGMFARNNPDLKVANLGVSSCSPIIYYTKIKYLINNGYNFKHVVILIDIYDVQDEAVYYAEKNGIVVEGKRSFATNFSENQSAWEKAKLSIYVFIQHHSQITHKAKKLLKSMFSSAEDTAKNLEALNLANDPRGAWTYDENSPAYGQLGVKGGIANAVYYMEKLKTLLDQHGILMSVGVYPWESQLTFNEREHKGATLWRDFCLRVSCANFINANDFFSEKDKDWLKKDR